MPRKKLIPRDRSRLIAVTNTLILAENPLRRWVSFGNSGDNDIFIQLGAEAEAGKGIYIRAKGGAVLLDMFLTPWYGDISGIAITLASNLACIEVVWET